MSREPRPTRPEPAEVRYPPFARTAAERRRWDLAEQIAREIFGDDGPASVWAATRAIYRSEIET